MKMITKSSRFSFRIFFRTFNQCFANLIGTEIETVKNTCACKQTQVSEDYSGTIGFEVPSCSDFSKQNYIRFDLLAAGSELVEPKCVPRVHKFGPALAFGRSGEIQRTKVDEKVDKDRRQSDHDRRHPLPQLLRSFASQNAQDSAGISL